MFSDSKKVVDGFFRLRRSHIAVNFTSDHIVSVLPRDFVARTPKAQAQALLGGKAIVVIHDPRGSMDAPCMEDLAIFSYIYPIDDPKFWMNIP